MLEAYESLLKALTAAAKWLMLALTTAIFLVICFAVFSRYILNYVPSWSEEVPRYLLVWITYLGAALAVNYQEHISLDVFFNLMPARARLPARLLLNLLVGLVGLIMLVFGVGLVRSFGDDLMESIPVPNVLLYLAMPVSGSMIVLYVVRQEARIVQALRGRGGGAGAAHEVVPI
jgi:TRAP-type C4-dicarboxylate transport system permease small subunit